MLTVGELGLNVDLIDVKQMKSRAQCWHKKRIGVPECPPFSEWWVVHSTD